MRFTSLLLLGAVAVGVLDPVHAVGLNEKIVCEGKCQRAKCPKKLQFQDESMCCPQCQCRYRGQTIKPGESICMKGRICTCNNGKMSCSMPKCPTRSLNCVDNAVGEDCCLYCPNGRTCYPSFDVKTVIKYGEYKPVKNNICACGGDPWYPYAFCAPKKVSQSLVKTYGDYLITYMEV